MKWNIFLVFVSDISKLDYYNYLNSNLKILLFDKTQIRKNISDE